MEKLKNELLGFVVKWKSNESCLDFFLSAPCDTEIEKHLDELVIRVSTCEVDQPYKILTFQHTGSKRLGRSAKLHKIQFGPTLLRKKNAPVTSFTHFHYH